MKLQIDTTAKTIKIEQTVKITELVNIVKKLLPDSWKEYSLETGSVIYWPSYPVFTYDRWNPQPLPYYTTCNVEIN